MSILAWGLWFCFTVRIFCFAKPWYRSLLWLFVITILTKPSMYSVETFGCLDSKLFYWKGIHTYIKFLYFSVSWLSPLFLTDSFTMCRLFVLLWWTLATLRNSMLLAWWMSRLKRMSGKLINLNNCPFAYVLPFTNFIIYYVCLFTCLVSVSFWNDLFSLSYRVVEIICNLVKNLPLNSYGAALMSMGVKILGIMLFW